MKLRLTMESGEHETPIDFASRLSTRACWDDMREFCKFYGFDPQSLIDGEEAAIRALANLARVDAEPLLREAFVSDETKQRFTHKGQTLVRHSLTRNRVRMCPACMHEDIEARDYRLSARSHRRSEWIVRGVRTCDRHGMGLVELGRIDVPSSLHDASRVIAEAIPRLKALTNAAPKRQPSGFETYVIGRLSGIKSKSWLDELPLYAAHQLCLVMGAVATIGPDVTLDGLTEDEAWQCEEAGHSIASNGVDGIRGFLDEFLALNRNHRAARGPKMLYGRLYDWLAHESRDEAYEPIRKIIIEHSIDALAYGPGDELFGRPIPERRAHTVRSASQEFGLHPKRLRRLLHQEQYTENGLGGPADHKVTFDAEKASTFLENLSVSMTLAQARDYLGVPRPHERGLLERGFIKPMLRGGKRKGPHAFLKSDLDGFLDLLKRHVDPALRDSEHLKPFTAAARRCCCTVMDVVALVVEEKLSRIGCDERKQGFASILVDVREVRPLVTGTDY